MTMVKTVSAKTGKEDTLQTTKLTSDTLAMIRIIQGYAMFHGERETQAEIVERLVKVEYDRIQALENGKK